MIEVRGSRAAIRKAYDIFSFFYGFIVAPIAKPAIRAGLARAMPQPGQRILDAGCGAGNVYRQFHHAVGGDGLAVGIDLAPRMLAATRRRLPDARLARAEIGQLPFAAGSFDLVWSSYVLDLIPTNELDGVLHEFLRVLKPDGRLVLVCFTNPGEKPTWWERLYVRTPSWLVPYIFGSCRPVRLAPFVEAAGFAAIEIAIILKGMRSEIVTARKPGPRQEWQPRQA